MPYDGSAGHGASSEAKQAHFRRILAAHMSATWRGVMEKYRRSGWRHHGAYLYWDLHAGPGRYEDGSLGSPLIALEVAAQVGTNIDAGLFEQNPATVARLRGVLGQARTLHPAVVGRFHVIQGDHADTAPQVLAALEEHITGPAFGLAYADPNGTMLPIDVLAQIARAPALRRMDFLVYVAATSYKRLRGAEVPGARYLSEDLRALGKPHVWIREPMAQHQWTFALLSAWDGMPMPGGLQFHRWDSDDGHAVLDYLDISHRERHGVGSI